MTARSDILGDSKDNFRSVYLGVLISAICHLVFLAVLIYSPALKSDRKIMPSSINVSLVSLPEANPGPPLKKKARKVRKAEKNAAAKPVVVPDSEPKPLPEKKEEPAPEPKPEVKKVEKPAPEPQPVVEKVEKPVAVEEKPKVSLKKQTLKTGKLVEPTQEPEKKEEEAKPDSVAKAIEKIKQSVQDDKKENKEDGKSDSVAKAIEKIKQNVNAGSPDSVAKAIEKIKENIGNAGPEGGDDVDSPGLLGGTGGGSANGESSEMDLYQAEIRNRVQRNWVFSEQAAGTRKLQTVLVIKIMANGEINDVWFEQKSGNAYLDESAQKAILKSNPLPPLPNGYDRPFFTVGMIFTPAGVQ